jgi:hypothetical protein
LFMKMEMMWKDVAVWFILVLEAECKPLGNKIYKGFWKGNILSEKKETKRKWKWRSRVEEVKAIDNILSDDLVGMTHVPL